MLKTMLIGKSIFFQDSMRIGQVNSTGSMSEMIFLLILVRMQSCPLMFLTVFWELNS
jgi:hypothetical protein